MSTVKHWGEIEPREEPEQADRAAEVYEQTVANLSMLGPFKLHQPYSADDSTLKEIPPECTKMDDNIIQSIKLLQKIKNQQPAVGKPQSSTSLEERDFDQEMAMDTDDGEIAERSHKHKIRRYLMDLDRGYSSFAQGHGSSPPELRAHVAREILQKSVAALLAQAGYDGSKRSSLDTLTDAAQQFFLQLTKLLRVAVDRDSEEGPHGFPDSVEWVFFEAGLGSVTSLHQYYQERVLSYRRNLEVQVNKLPTLPPQEEEEQGVVVKEEIEDDDVPELHFPALSNGEASEEMQSSLEPGFQMLHSLEEEALG